MESDGLVRRKLQKNDRRRFDVALTNKGPQRFEQVWPGHEDGIQRYFIRPLSPPDLDELGRILVKLIQANEAAAKPGDQVPDR